MEKRSPTLRRRLLLQISVMVAAVLMMAIVAMLGVERIHQDLGLTVRAFRELRSVYETGFDISTAQSALDAREGLAPDRAKAQSALRLAIDVLTSSDRNDRADPLPLSQWLDETRPAGAEILAILRGSEDKLSAPVDPSETSVAFERALQSLSSVSETIRAAIGERQQKIASARRNALLTDAIIGALATIAVLAIGRREYRAVIDPLDRLGAAVRRISGGDFAFRVQSAGDREFAQLAEDFNRMADELQQLYFGLEEKIAAKSKELVRSQRLASVGYLAAGVAHEINNPLGVIAGYGERSLDLMGRGLNEDSASKTIAALRIICEQAFRCKEITDRLLMLSRPSPEVRGIVSMRVLVEEVLPTISGLPQAADRHLEFHPDPNQANQDYAVTGNAGELKQVLVNLLVNAIEATPPGTGMINLGLAHKSGKVELTVSDNGRGMAPQTLEHVFEPFFTDKRTGHGTGLGLSITHAIVEDHGGSITASSAGLGLGSQFLLILPATSKGASRE